MSKSRRERRGFRPNYYGESRPTLYHLLKVNRDLKDLRMLENRVVSRFYLIIK